MTASPPGAAVPAGSRRPVRRVLVVLLAALAGGGILGALGGWIGWQPARSVALPSTTDAVQLAQVVDGTTTAEDPLERHDYLWGYSYGAGVDPLLLLLGGEDGFGPGQVELQLTSAAPRGVVVDRLTAAGWRVITSRDGLRAARGDLAVEITLDQAYPDDTWVDIYRAQPVAVSWLATAGLLLGLAGGAALGRRLARRPGRASTLTILGLAVLALADLGAVAGVAELWFLPRGVVDTDLFAAYMIGPVKPLNWAGVLLSVAGVAMIAARRWARRPRARPVADTAG